VFGREGGGCSGGGSVIRFNDNKFWVFLDLLTQPKLLDMMMSRPPQLACPSVPEPKSSPQFSPLRECYREAFEAADQRMADWIKAIFSKNPAIAAALSFWRNDIEDMPFVRTTLRFKPGLRSFMPAGFRNKLEVQTVVLYTQKYGGFLSGDVWDVLDIDTQMALLIHEGFRQTQFAHNVTDLSDEQLERISAVLAYETPSANVDLESMFSTTMKQLGKESAGILNSLGERFASRLASDVNSQKREALTTSFKLNFLLQPSPTSTTRGQQSLVDKLVGPDASPLYAKEVVDWLDENGLLARSK
jgi:hypothetical protein